MNKEIQKSKVMQNYTVDNYQVRKQLNVNTITAVTIESLIKYLNITEKDTEFEIEKRLSMSMAARKTLPKQVAPQLEEEDFERDTK